MAITLSADAATRLRSSIKRFMAEHFDEEIGELKAQMLLDFCLIEVGSVVYNRAVADAQRRLLESVNDLDGVCHQPEFTYWSRSGRKAQ